MARASLELLHIPYSPWSEKARWALAARGVSYRSRIYQPILGEPELRWRLRRLRGPITVPVLFGAGEARADSFDIARYAASVGAGPELFPPGSEAAIAAWNALSERALAAGRVLSLRRTLADDEALREMLPKRLRPVLGKVGVKIADQGVRRTLKKYAPTIGAEDPEAVLCAALDELRRALGPAPVGPDGAPRHLIGDALTYADISAAQALAFVTPPTSGLRIGRANREAFTQAAIAARYGDLLAWRDALYARHRG